MSAEIRLGRHRLYHGDALDMMRELPDASVNAVVTDPPYCSGGFNEAARRASKGLISDEGLDKFGWFANDNMGSAGLVWLLRAVATQSSRLLKDGGSFLVFCDWRMIPSIQPAMESAGLRWQQLIVWDKQSTGLGTGFRSQHECILHYVKGTGVFYSATFGNVIRCGRTKNDEREHPTQKPAELMRVLSTVVSPVGGCILDPFTGSGSTAVGAIQAGSTFIGAEREARFIEVARGRIQAAEAAISRDASPVDGRASQASLLAQLEEAS